MAAATLLQTSVPMTNAGLNLTDATFTTLVAGGSNGVTFLWNPTDVLVLKNDTGGAAVFSFTPSVPASLTEQSITLAAKTLSVANGKTYAVRVAEIFKSTSTGYVTVTCDVAGKSLLLAL